MNKLKVRIISPKEVIFEEEIFSVSSVNSVGNFDILPEHANFITLVEKKEILVRKLNKEKVSFNFEMAIIYNSENKVTIYTDLHQPLIKK